MRPRGLPSPQRKCTPSYWYYPTAPSRMLELRRAIEDELNADLAAAFAAGEEAAFRRAVGSPSTRSPTSIRTAGIPSFQERHLPSRRRGNVTFLARSCS